MLLKEELGIEALTMNYVFSIIEVFDKETNREGVVLFFICDTYSGTTTVMEEDKCSEPSWFDINALPENMIPSAKGAVMCYLQGKVYNEYGF